MKHMQAAAIIMATGILPFGRGQCLSLSKSHAPGALLMVAGHSAGSPSNLARGVMVLSS